MLHSTADAGSNEPKGERRPTLRNFGLRVNTKNFTRPAGFLSCRRLRMVAPLGDSWSRRRPRMHDLVIDNARIVDGTGAPSRQGTVAVKDGRIVEVAAAAGQAARERLDAGGLAVAPLTQMRGATEAGPSMELPPST